MKMSEYRKQAARHILVYGAPKSGKTTLIAQLAAKYKLWWFDFEDGIKTILNPALVKPELLENIELFKIPDRQTYPMAIETMLKVFKGTPTAICHEHGKVDCPLCKKSAPDAFSRINLADFDNTKDVLVLDSWSQLAESAMNYIMREQISKDNFDAKATWDDYGKQGRILERIGSIIQTAPFNVVIASHELMVEMEDGAKRIVPIGGTSNFSKTFAKYFDDVVYTEIMNRSHRPVSSTTAKANVLAGSRSGVDLKAGDSLLKLFE